MSEAEYLYGALMAIMGVACGVLTSYYFVRSQQKTDFNKLHTGIDKLTNANNILSELHKLINEIRQDTSEIKFAASREAISGLRASMELLREKHYDLIQKFTDLPDGILEHLRRYQAQLLATVHKKIEAQINKSENNLTDLFRAELSSLSIPSALQEATLHNLTRYTSNVLMEMTRLHTHSIVSEASKSLVSEDKFSSDLVAIKSDLDSVGLHIDAVTSSPLIQEAFPKSEDALTALVAPTPSNRKMPILKPPLPKALSARKKATGL